MTLTGDRIVWSVGEKREARLGDISAVHLQTGSVGKNTIASCRLTFRDGSTFLIASNNGRGLQDDERDRSYTAFVHNIPTELMGAPLALS